MNKFQFRALTEAITPIILKDFETFMDDLKNSPKILKEIDNKIEYFEKLEDTVNDTLVDLTLMSDRISLYIDNVGFYYDKLTDSIKIDSDIENTAKYRVYSDNNLSNEWNNRGNISNKVHAIIATTDDLSFDATLEIVRSGINFKEYLKA